MNIVTPFPLTPLLNTANPNTEAARRDNLLRETIPQPTDAKASEAEQGLGSQGDRARQSGTQLNNSLIYERPTIQTPSIEQITSNGPGEQDNANDESTGRESAEQEQANQAEIRELQARDREVRAHEQAHAAVGGQYAGAPQYEFETGPDGQRYAVGGEVSIDVSEESTPEASLRKFQQVRAAALAPAEPSPQDFRVASEAARGALEAQAEINREATEQTEEPESDPEQTTTTDVSSSSQTDTINEQDINSSVQGVDNASLEDSNARNNSGQNNNNREGFFASRNSIISQFYERTATEQSSSFSISA